MPYWAEQFSVSHISAQFFVLSHPQQVIYSSLLLFQVRVFVIFQGCQLQQCQFRLQKKNKDLKNTINHLHKTDP